MARPFKIVLIVLGVVVLVVAGALTAAVMLFDPNDYRTQISKLVKDKTGRDLSIGSIDMSVFPWLKIDLKNVSLSEAPGYGTEPFAKIGEAKVGVQLLPLLRDRKVTVDGVELRGLVLNITKSADGKSNWEDLAGDKKEEDPNKPSAIKLEDIDIGGIEIVDAAIRYRDDVSKQTYVIQDFDLKTGALKPGKPFDIETAIKARLEAQKMDAELKLSTHVDPNLKTQELKLEDIELELQAKGAQQATIKLTGNALANLQTKLVQVDKLVLDVDGKTAQQQGTAKLTGNVSGNYGTLVFGMKDLKLAASGKTPTIEGKADIKGAVNADLKAKLFQIAGLVLDATASGKALPGGSQTLQLSSSSVAINQTTGRGQLKNLVLKAGGLQAQSELALDGLNTGGTPHFVGPITVAPFNARELLAKFSTTPLTTADPKALTSISFKSQLDGSAKSVKLNDLILKLDQTTASGSLSVRDFASMAIAFVLRVDQIDADRYLPPKPPAADPKAKPEVKSTPQAKADLNKTVIPVESLTNLNIDCKLDIGKLKLSNLNLADVRMTIAGPKGAAKQLTLNGKLYNGSFALNTRIAPGARPTYAVKTNLDAITIAPFLKDFLANDKLSGIGTIALDLTSAGKTVGDVRQALNGTVSLNFKDGAVKGFNLAEMIRRGQALLQGTQYVPSPEPVQTDFAAIDFSGQIVNGVLKSNSLDARNPLLRVGGEGQIDLAKETFNYTAKPTIVGSSKGQGGRGLDQLEGVTLPIKLTGTFAAPKYKIDFAGAAKSRAKQEVKKQVDEHKEELKQKLNDKLGPALDGLFGIKKKKAAAPAEPAPAEAAPAEPAPATP